MAAQLVNEKKFQKESIKTTIIKESSLQKFKNTLGWKGDGTKQNPIIIDNITGLKPTLYITRSDIYYYIKGITLYNLKINRSMNIVIENCKMYLLELEGCKNIMIKNNQIEALKLLYSRANIFEDNKFTQGILNNLDSKYLEEYTTNWTKFAWSLIGCIAVILVWMLFAGGWIYAILMGIMIVIFLIIIRMFQKKQKATEGLPPNQFHNNSLLEDITVLEKEIISKYNWYK